MFRRRTLLLGLSLLGAAALSAGAETIQVPGDYLTIQEAIDAAHDGDTIHVDPGTYSENLVIPGAGGATDLALIGSGAGSTVVDGEGEGPCLIGKGLPETARIEGFTFRDGYSNQGGGLHLDQSALTVAENEIIGNTAEDDNDSKTPEGGGGLFLSSSPATLVNNTISVNNMTGLFACGAGVFLLDSDAFLSGNTITDNMGGDGGGVYLFNSSATLVNNTITGNTPDFNGGGLYLDFSTVILEDSTVTGNQADYGGGLYLTHSFVALVNNDISSNGAYYDGGGVYLEESDGVLENNTISENQVGLDGGGLYLFNSPVSFFGNTISNNLCGIYEGLGGGGMYLWDSAGVLRGNTITGNSTFETPDNTLGGGGGVRLVSSDPTLEDNTISNNTTDGYGGGLYLNSSSPQLTGNRISGNVADQEGDGLYIYFHSKASLNGDTIADNGGAGAWVEDQSHPLFTNCIVSGNSGDGLYLMGSEAILTNNTVVDNTGSGVLADDVETGAPTVTNCILWGNGGGGDLVGVAATYSSVGTGETEGEGNIHEEPHFVGGGDYHLQPDSPGVNQGSNEAPQLPDTDLDGNPRILNGTVDMGADEVPAPSWQPDLRVKYQGSWLGRDLYNDDGTGQTALQTCGIGQTAVFKVELYNNGEDTETFWVQGPAGDENWDLRYYWGPKVKANREVTAEVTSPTGWERPGVLVGGKRSLLITVTPGSLAEGTREVLVMARSDTDPNQKDAVGANTTVPSVQADLWIKYAGSWGGDGVYNNDGAGQTARQKKLPGETASFRVRLYNDGDETGTFFIQGPPGDADWTVEYFKGSKNVTDLVTSPKGWKRVAVPPGGRRAFRVEVTPSSELPAGSVFKVRVRAESQRDPAQRDCIKAVTKVK